MAKVLIACEESQAVCIEFRKLGHEAYSNDIQDCSGNHPEWHLKMDVFEAINLKDWDCMIAFPPCTHLAVSGAAWFEEKRKDGRQQKGIDFFLAIANANIKRIAIENPVGIMSKHYRKPDQIINPYYFGDPTPKKTCLWLKNLPKLYHCKEVDLFSKEVTHAEPEFIIGKRDGKKYSLIHYQTITKDPSERGKIRSKTFPGIAKAMAEQWSKLL
jgi:site-specific DNA-cytosine methylase